MQRVEWFDLDRPETLENRLEEVDLGNGTIRKNLALGINLYENAIPKEVCNEIIERLETLLSDKEDPKYKWSTSFVNEYQAVSSARSCADFKYGESNKDPESEKGKEAQSLYDLVDNAVKVCLGDYESTWLLKMNYFEVFNFVKYEGGEYFKIHADDGPYSSYTISLVVYLNDDYDGGEIEWNRFGLKVKPSAGSIAIFPSTFIYEHASHDIKDGTKYAVVIMTAYNDRNFRQRKFGYNEQ